MHMPERKPSFRSAIALVVAITLVVTAGVASVTASPGKSVASDDFGRSSDDAGWGVSDSGARWLHPTGKAGFSLSSGRGVIRHPGTAKPRLATLDARLRDTAVAFEFYLESGATGPSPKAMAIVRKSAAGQYRLGVRIGKGGKVILSISKARFGGRMKGLGAPVTINDLTYRSGDRLRVLAQVIKRDPTQLRMKVWPSGTAQPSHWQIVRNDGSNDVAAAGRAGLASIPVGQPKARVGIRFDDLAVRSAANLKRVPAQSSSNGPSPKPKAAPKPTPKPTPDPAPAPKGIKVPSSIDSSGKSNVSSKMASFIKGVPNGSTIVFPANATYLLDGNGIVLTDRKDLIFEGRGTTLKFTGCGTPDSAFRLQDTSGIKIRDFVLLGDNPGNYKAGCEASEGVAMYGAVDTTISRVEVRRPYGHCFYAEQTWRWTSDVLIKDSKCVRPGVMGLAVVAGRDITVEDSTFKDISLFPFDIEPHHHAGGGESIIIRDNVIDGFGVSPKYTPWVLAAAPDIGTYRDIRFIRNHVVKGASHGKTLAGLAMRLDGTAPKRDIIIRDNTTSIAGEGPVMRFRNVNGLTVTGNKQPLKGGKLISCSGCSNVDAQ